MRWPNEGRDVDPTERRGGESVRARRPGPPWAPHRLGQVRRRPAVNARPARASAPAMIAIQAPVLGELPSSAPADCAVGVVLWLGWPGRTAPLSCEPWAAFGLAPAPGSARYGNSSLSGTSL